MHKVKLLALECPSNCAIGFGLDHKNKWTHGLANILSLNNMLFNSTIAKIVYNCKTPSNPTFKRDGYNHL